MEECNGRDDDCDGSVDEDDVCGGSARCFIDGLGCGGSEVCAGSSCTDSCNADVDCGDSEQCKPVKNQYGASDETVQGCVLDQAGFCEIGCSVLVSSVDDETMQKYIDCMMDGQAACNAAQGCALLLPIMF